MNGRNPDRRSDYDDLADAFLTDGPAETATMAPVRPTSLIAAMLVNLPVIAGPWIEQLASSRAQDHGPTGLLREREGLISVDLIAGREGAGALAAVLTGRPATLEAAVRQCLPIISQWIVEVRSGESALAPDLSRFDEILLVTGADEAATVAAFREVKRLADRPGSVRMTVVVAGSEAGAAHEAAERVSLACRRSLGIEIAAGRPISRMRPIPMRHLGRFESPGNCVALVRRLLTEAAHRGASEAPARGPLEVRTAPAAAATAGRIALRPRVASNGATRLEGSGDAQSLPPPGGSAATGYSVGEVAAPTCAPQHEAQASAAPDRADPAPIASAAPTRAAFPQTAEASVPPGALVEAGHARGRLVDSLIELLPGVRAMQVDCPRASGVEFGFDAAGALHALAEDDTDASLQRLLVACDWAREHAALLQRLNPFLAHEAGAEAAALRIVGHLFTSRPRDRRHLADGSLRLHVLIRDASDRRVVLAHVDLN